MDAAKQKGRRALYKITQVTSMKKKLAAIKNKVERAIDGVENLEKAVGNAVGSRKGAARGKFHCQIVQWQNRSWSMVQSCLNSTSGNMGQDRQSRQQGGRQCRK